jgi:hypothetical protein
MPITIPDQKLLSRKEVAELLDVSYDAIATRACGTECLMEIRVTKKVLFNPYQVAAHIWAIYDFGECEGRCKSALTQSRTLQFKKSA